MSNKVCPIENNTNLNSIFCLIKSSKFDFIFSPAFYLIMWLITSHSAYVATETESNGVKIDGLLPPSFL